MAGSSQVAHLVHHAHIKRPEPTQLDGEIEAQDLGQEGTGELRDSEEVGGQSKSAAENPGQAMKSAEVNSGNRIPSPSRRRRKMFAWFWSESPPGPFPSIDREEASGRRGVAAIEPGGLFAASSRPRAPAARAGSEASGIPRGRGAAARRTAGRWRPRDGKSHRYAPPRHRGCTGRTARSSPRMGPRKAVAVFLRKRCTSDRAAGNSPG